MGDDCDDVVGAIDCSLGKTNPAQAKAVNDIMDTDNDCNSDCSSDACKIAFLTILYFHDTCTHDQINTELEHELHEYETSCVGKAGHDCNVVKAPFEPNMCKGKYVGPSTTAGPESSSFSVFAS